MATLRRYVEAILRGEYDRAPVEPPRWPLDDLEELAQAAHERARRPSPFCDPRHLAHACGLRLIPRAPPGVCGEAVSRGRLAYAPDADPQAQGLLILHGLAHAILHTEPAGSTHADTWLLTGALAIPRRALRLARERPSLATAHLPPWFVFGRLITASLRKTAAG